MIAKTFSKRLLSSTRTQVVQSAPQAKNRLSHSHVLRLDSCNTIGGSHGVPAEGLAQLLVEDYLNECRFVPLHLSLNGTREGSLELCWRRHLDAHQATSASNFSVLDAKVQLCANEIVVVPQRGVSLLCAPLEVPKYHHRDGRPITAAACSKLVHGDAKSSIPSETDNRNFGLSNLGAKNGWKPIATRSKEARGEILPARREARVGVADSAIVADIGGDDGVGRQ